MYTKISICFPPLAAPRAAALALLGEDEPGHHPGTTLCSGPCEGFMHGPAIVK